MCLKVFISHVKENVLENENFPGIIVLSSIMQRELFTIGAHRLEKVIDLIKYSATNQIRSCTYCIQTRIRYVYIVISNVYKLMRLIHVSIIELFIIFKQNVFFSCRFLIVK